jgi:c-di-GMP-binding flagellar brake protein YcgR
MSDSYDDFRTVTFEKDRARAVESLATIKPECTAVWLGKTSFHCTVLGEAHSTIVLDVPQKDQLGMSDGDPIDLMFSLSDGQYLISTKLKDLAGTAIGFPTSVEVKRLQRRENFRVHVAEEFRGFLTVFDGALKQDLTLIDLSVGGAKARWVSGAVKPENGKTYPASLHFDDKKILIDVSIRTIVNDGPHATVGLQFGTLSGPDQQAILFLCVQLQRGQARIL